MDASIVIPSYGRPKQLRACVAALERLDYPRDRFEVIIVDDASPRPVEAVSQRLDLRVVRQPMNGGPGAARNRGAAEARGRFVAFTDDDCAPGPAWLRQVVARLEQHPGAMVGGRTVNGLVGNCYSAASQALIDYLYAYFNRDAGAATFFASNNMAMPAAAFAAAGGFDVSLRQVAGEDRDLCGRWRHQGRPMVFAPEMVIRHFHALSASSFCRQHFVYGRGAYSYHTLRARRANSGIRVEPLRFYRDLIAHAFAAERGARAQQLAALLTLTQVVHAAGFFCEAGVKGIAMLDVVRRLGRSRPHIAVAPPIPPRPATGGTGARVA